MGWRKEEGRKEGRRRKCDEGLVEMRKGKKRKEGMIAR